MWGKSKTITAAALSGANDEASDTILNWRERLDGGPMRHPERPAGDGSQI